MSAHKITDQQSCSCEGMPEHGKTPHAGHLSDCPMSAARCNQHGDNLRLGCSICHNAAKMIGVSPKPCDYDPRPLSGKPIGMFHCPKCGEMQVAGLPHLPPDDEVLPWLR